MGAQGGNVQIHNIPMCKLERSEVMCKLKMCGCANWSAVADASFLRMTKGGLVCRPGRVIARLLRCRLTHKSTRLLAMTN
jgi:hypothetical protein